MKKLKLRYKTMLAVALITLINLGIATIAPKLGNEVLAAFQLFAIPAFIVRLIVPDGRVMGVTFLGATFYWGLIGYLIGYAYERTKNNSQLVRIVVASLPLALSFMIAVYNFSHFD